MKRPDLSWSLENYKKDDVEPPEELIENPEKTEGEIMTDEEIEIWFLESIKGLRVIREENESLFEGLQKGFIKDIRYLESIGKMKKGVAEEVTEKTVLGFEE